MDIKGHTVHKVMLAQTAEIEAEYYVSFLLDRSNRTFLAMASVEGGMEIEEIAVSKPEALAKVPVDAAAYHEGLSQEKADEIVKAANFPHHVADQVAATLVTLWDVFVKEDATLVEVNPLVKTKDGKIVALDGKVSLDENAAFRHEDHAALEDKASADPLEAKAKAKHLNYVKLDGEVGIIGNGAGLVMSTLDVVAYAGREARRRQAGQLPGHRRRRLGRGHGQRPGHHPERPGREVGVRQRLRRHHRVRRGRQRHRAGLRAARRGEAGTKPLVVRLDGNNAELGRQILVDAKLPGVEQVDTMDGAADRAAELANAR